jgi:hypothetical protein
MRSLALGKPGVSLNNGIVKALKSCHEKAEQGTDMRPPPCATRCMLKLVAQPVFLANEAVDRLRPEMFCCRILEYQRDVRELHVWRACSSRNTDLQL